MSTTAEASEVVTDRDAHLAAIIAAPKDDAPRLVFADWLDENGEQERAEFVRLQIRLADVPPEPETCHPPLIDGRPDRYHGMSCPFCRWIDEYEWSRPLRERERALIQANGLAWVRDLPGGPWAVDGRGDGFANKCTFDRGFVGRVECPLAVLFGGPCGRCEGRGTICQICLDADSPSYDHHGSDPCPACKGSGRTPGVAEVLFRAQPITEVGLTDREPWVDGVLGLDKPFQWFRGPRPIGLRGNADLPAKLFCLIPHEDRTENRSFHESAEDAHAALSRACVAYGRRRAGLPELF